MKKAVCGISLLLALTIFILLENTDKIETAQAPCVQGIYVPALVQEVDALKIELDEPENEDLKTRLLYQYARRSIVKVSMIEHAGSGIIWRIDDDRIVIASNRHLLMEDVEARVTFWDNEKVNAKIMGYSQQYDVGFLYIDTDEVPSTTLRVIYQAAPLLENLEDNDTRIAFLAERTGLDIVQLGADLGAEDNCFFKGYIKMVGFTPVFNCFMLQTQCYARAGMSGGGMFDTGGRLLGMISGGDVAIDAEVREGEVTYSLPAWTIESEYLMVLQDFEEY